MGCALWVRGTIAHNSDVQQRLQTAQLERGRLLKLQLDEETGVRGYLATGSRVYLQPYDAARRIFPTTYVQLELADAIARRALEVTAAGNGLIARLLVGALATCALIVSGYGFAQNRLSRRLQKEHQAAEVLQEAFLGPKLPSFPNIALHGAYAPARDESRVGGDWYDAYVIGGGQLLFSIGDVSGHGLEAAVVMSRVRQTITTAAMTDADPAAVLRIANEVLLLQEGRLVTVACGCVDLDTGKVTYATAGHPPMLLVPRGAVRLLATGGLPLGTMSTPSYRSSSLQAEPGSALVLYTDGLTEHARDNVAGERALIETVRALDFHSDDPAAALLASVLSGTPPTDDVAILTLTFLQAPKRALRVVCA